MESGNYILLEKMQTFCRKNEPQCFVGLGFLKGEHAPGIKAPLRDTFEMSHNVLKAHGYAVQMLRQYGKQPLIIGYAPTGTMCYMESRFTLQKMVYPVTIRFLLMEKCMTRIESIF